MALSIKVVGLAPAGKITFKYRGIQTDSVVKFTVFSYPCIETSYLGMKLYTWVHI
jgi:hypothetical protein